MTVRSRTLRSDWGAALGALALIVAVASPLSASAQEAILDDPARAEGERERDAGSKPLEVYAFWGIESGMTVADMMPGGGYNTFILSKLVGDSGKVYAGPDRRSRSSACPVTLRPTASTSWSRCGTCMIWETALEASSRPAWQR